MPWTAVYFFHYELMSEDCYLGPMLLTCFAPEQCVVGKETKQLLGGKRLNGLGFFFLPSSLPSFLLSFTGQMLLKFIMSGSHRRGKGFVLLEAFAVFPTDPETQLVWITWGNTLDSQS